MAINPKKLAAFAKAQPTDDDEGVEPEAENEALDEGQEHEEPDDEEAELAAQGESDLAPFAPLIELLEEFAEDLIPLVDEMDPELLLAPDEPLPDDEVAILREGLATLDGRLRRELARALKGASLDQCAAVGDHVANESPAEDDPAKLGGWLWRVAVLATPRRSREIQPTMGSDEHEPEAGL